MEKLKEEFDGVKTVKLLTLKREFEMTRMKEGDTVKDYSAKLLEIVNKIRLFGGVFPDSKVGEKMMINFPARFGSKISVKEESCDLKTLSKQLGDRKLQAQEQRSSIRDEEVAEVAFQEKHKGKHPMKDNKMMEGDKVAKGKTWKESFKEREVSTLQPLSLEKNYRVKQNQPQQNHLQQANFTEESEKEEKVLFMASHEENTTNKSTWFTGSGCTSHMSHNELLFHTLNKLIRTKFRMGNGETVEAQGKGSVAFQTKQEMVNKIFPLDENLDSANFASLDDSWSWHKRYGHFNCATLKSMYEKGLTKDLLEISLLRFTFMQVHKSY
ncbi:uncharacterized protein LOC132063180 [Lycium ferocissimum]|uniref:uncharacterized protein LOC132063180 n=1 Tax=Lycium ferocissimum TaxID=112874 RepID=UPI002814A451|nr:uncharacterized protein LOC132063180 [Lycium ferocissimum]